MAYNLVDPNQSTSEVQRIRTLRRTIVLGLIAAGLAVFFFPLLFISGRVDDDISRMEAEITTLRDQTSMASLPAPDVQALLNEASEVESLISTLSAVSNTLGVQWSAVATTIANHDREQIVLTSLVQNGPTLLLTGRSAGNLVIAEYVAVLDGSSVFAGVDIRSIQLSEPTLSATATAPISEEAEPPTAGTPLPPSPPALSTQLPFEFAIEFQLREPLP